MEANARNRKGDRKMTVLVTGGAGHIGSHSVLDMVRALEVVI